MVIAKQGTLGFLPLGEVAPTAAKAGFRSGERGTHSSRTLMLDDLATVLTVVPESGGRDAYASAIIDGNCLQKPTASTRRISNQRLGELYALNRSYPVFRVLRRLWSVSDQGRPLLALLAALARDPLLMASAKPVLSLPVGAELHRGPIRDALRELVGERMNDDTLDKVVRNVSSSWRQTGHLHGRTFKIRDRVQAQPTSLAFALYLGYVVGFRGEDLLKSGWVSVLDCTASSGRVLALEAKRAGLIDLRSAGDVIEFGLERLEPGIGRT